MDKSDFVIQKDVLKRYKGSGDAEDSECKM